MDSFNETPKPVYISININDKVETSIVNDDLLDANGKQTLIYTRRGMINNAKSTDA